MNEIIYYTIRRTRRLKPETICRHRLKMRAKKREAFIEKLKSQGDCGFVVSISSLLFISNTLDKSFFRKENSEKRK